MGGTADKLLRPSSIVKRRRKRSSTTPTHDVYVCFSPLVNFALIGLAAYIGPRSSAFMASPLSERPLHTSYRLPTAIHGKRSIGGSSRSDSVGNSGEKEAIPGREKNFDIDNNGRHNPNTINISFTNADTDSEAQDSATYYSPNAALDPTKYRYDLEDGSETDKDSTLDGASTAANANAPEFNEYSFFDEATIYVRAGSGGQGASTYKKGVGGQNGQPDGGNGGRGGDVILEVDDSLNTLAGLTDAWRPNAFGGGGAARTSVGGGGGSSQGFRPKSFRAENGQDGMRQFKTGRNGKDAVVTVPPGTVVQEEVDIIDEVQLAETGERVVLRTETHDLSTVTIDKPALVVAVGGEGGEGSATTGKKAGRGVRRPRSPPVGGERARLKLTLKIVADVALVGVPNAGKSTFLASVTRAKPKIANYPFTTVVPNLGVWVPPGSGGYISDSSAEGGSGSAGLVLCDVPGLIAGAAEGVGLGHAFLRHVERCHVILHLVDATSADPIGDFDMLNREILRYGNGKLARMPQIVVVNKVDAWEEGKGEEWEQGLKARMGKEELEDKLRSTMTHSRLMWMSAKEGEGVDDLMARMAMFVRKVKNVSDEN
mmetsp:Transcript_33268/g.67125  ORF Transcript_33268/g.67125 Transcript_33268/m.67125 type:complete len:599 (+) Transcript_33268:141-1937(+)